MRDEIVHGQCIGDVRLCAIDTGFGLAALGMPVDLTEEDDETLATGGVGYDDPDGRKHLLRGTRDEVCRQLARAGYIIIAARTPAGDEIRCEPGNPDAFVVGDREFSSLSEAMSQCS